MSTTIVASGAGAASSSDIVLGDGASTTLTVIGSGGGQYTIEIKDTVGGGYTPFFTLGSGNSPRVIQAPGTFRVSRVLNGFTSAVTRD